MNKLICALIIASIILVSGCTSFEEKVTVEEHCILHCQAAVQAEEDLSAGACLSDNNPEWTVDDWVCDIAHNPRTDVDDQPENQCEEYRNGNANHFVEVDTECNLIKKN
ncbi:MAG: hypothetical protein QF475_01640 [Candidatus Undinarchaeales archaeon]|jgi:hypothetical protein|nr:hypothetical protein [Candidatus Undinarchaeales archaeon]